MPERAATLWADLREIRCAAAQQNHAATFCLDMFEDLGGLTSPRRSHSPDSRSPDTHSHSPRHLRFPRPKGQAPRPRRLRRSDHIHNSYSSPDDNIRRSSAGGRSGGDSTAIDVVRLAEIGPELVPMRWGLI